MALRWPLLGAHVWRTGDWVRSEGFGVFVRMLMHTDMDRTLRFEATRVRPRRTVVFPTVLGLRSSLRLLAPSVLAVCRWSMQHVAVAAAI